jgi:murein DD-endopeptidase MepM/ murein hydrolase activator NlpD
MKHKTSVLIVNSKEKVSKVHQVPTHIVVNWRKYVLFFSLFLVMFFVVSGFLIYQNTSRSYQEKLERANYIRRQIDLNKALTSFATIDSGIYRINSFLRERGLEELKVDNMGGVGADFDITHINEFAEFYQNQILGLESVLYSMPIGKPFDGEITSGYGYRRNPFTGRGVEFHSGIDFRGRLGDSVKTTGSGVVVFAGYNGGYGKCVVIEHEKNLQTMYGHLSKISVKEGEQVNSGQLVGLIGNTGRSTGPHVHYEIIVNGRGINPEKYISYADQKKSNS